MAVDMYRMYMDERLLAQLDWDACYIKFEMLLGEDFMQAPVSDAFSLQWSGTRLRRPGCTLLQGGGAKLHAHQSSSLMFW